MPELVNLEKLNLKNNPSVNEDMIQKYLYENPQVLGLGELTPLIREKNQATGGRLDLLFANENNNTRYEVEVQLGATDPSHIIRTIEYWDNERKRNQKYDHCAVIVAEEITGRFMNIISLFNGQIPLIAIQLSAHKTNDGKISLAFTKILDRLTPDDEDVTFEAADRAYWESRSSVKKMEEVDKIFSDLSEYLKDYELKYNKPYIGTTKNGKAENVINFRPKKKFIKISARGKDHGAMLDRIENAGLSANFDDRSSMYEIKVDSFADYHKNRDIFVDLVKGSIDYYYSNE